ncbi:MAG: rRNA maturation RNase YbeY [Paracoccaceae bacterium]
MSARPDTPPLVDLVVEHEPWLDALPDLAAVAERAARLALEGAGLSAAGREIALLACDDARIATLNADFRARPAPTNVLSWPAHDLAPPVPGLAPLPPPPGPLGDVAIALDTVRREAAAGGLSLKDHALHLILHGCLHLLGYDHETEADATLMEGIERERLVAIGLDDPYRNAEAG